MDLDFLIISIIVVFISVGITSVVYMFSKIIRNKDLEKYAQGEVYQAIASAFIIGGIFVIFSIINSTIIAMFSDIALCSGSACNYIATELRSEYDSVLHIIPLGFYLEKTSKDCTQDILLSEPEKSCHIQIAKERLHTINNVIRGYVSSQLTSYGVIFTLQTLEIGLKSPEESIKEALIKKGKGVSGFLETYEKISSRLGTFLPESLSPFSWIGLVREAFKVIYSVLYLESIYLTGAEMLLISIGKTIFPNLFILGIALRTFSASRKLGGLLLSISVCTYLIYPLLIILTTLIINPTGTTFEFEDISEVYVKQNTVIPFPLNLFSSVEVITKTGSVKVPFVYYKLFGLVMPGGIFEKAAILTIWIFTQQLIIIYATVISIREISVFLGGDIEIAGLSRLL
ncbi:MAG: hypothetical protein QXS37_03390 [Candidatus Aenigmatarchaeota archaeon]